MAVQHSQLLELRGMLTMRCKSTFAISNEYLIVVVRRHGLDGLLDEDGGSLQQKPLTISHPTTWLWDDVGVKNHKPRARLENSRSS